MPRGIYKRKKKKAAKKVQRARPPARAAKKKKRLGRPPGTKAEKIARAPRGISPNQMTVFGAMLQDRFDRLINAMHAIADAIDNRVDDGPDEAPAISTQGNTASAEPLVGATVS